MMISLGQQTYAQKIARYLRQNGIKSELMKIDAVGSQGCKWGLSIQNKDSMKATEILKKAGIKYGFVESH